MADELRNVMANLELALVETVARLEQAEMDLIYVDVLDLEQRIEALHDALAFVADSIAEEASPPIDRTSPSLPRPAAPGGGAGDQDHSADG